MILKHILKENTVLSLFLSILVLLAVPQEAKAQENSEKQKIIQVAEDFIDGWYEGDAEKIGSTFHPEMLSKVVSNRDNKSRLEVFTAQRLVELTRRGGGQSVPLDERRKDISILDLFQNAANVKIIAYDAVEYLHIAKWNGEWKIINILFERNEN